MTVPADVDAKQRIARQAALWVQRAMRDTAEVEAAALLNDPMFSDIDVWDIVEAAKASGRRVYATIRAQVDALLETAGLVPYSDEVARVCCDRIDEEIGWMLVDSDREADRNREIAELAESFCRMADLAARQAAFDVQEVLGLAHDGIQDLIGPLKD